jgi:hypothetical protein
MSALGQSRHLRRKKSCPLYPESGHVRCTSSCPLYPRKPTSNATYGMSAKGQKRTSGRAQSSSSSTLPSRGVFSLILSPLGSNATPKGDELLYFEGGWDVSARLFLC